MSSSLPYLISSNLLLLRAILFRCAQFITRLSSACRSSTWFTEEIVCRILVSSAKEVTVACCTSVSMSLVIIRNRRGPSTEPCGTPLVTVDGSDGLMCPGLLPLVAYTTSEEAVQPLTQSSTYAQVS